MHADLEGVHHKDNIQNFLLDKKKVIQKYPCPRFHHKSLRRGLLNQQTFTGHTVLCEITDLGTITYFYSTCEIQQISQRQAGLNTLPLCQQYKLLAA